MRNWNAKASSSSNTNVARLDTTYEELKYIHLGQARRLLNRIRYYLWGIEILLLFQRHNLPWIRLDTTYEELKWAFLLATFSAVTRIRYYLWGIEISWVIYDPMYPDRIRYYLWGIEIVFCYFSLYVSIEIRYYLWGIEIIKLRRKFNVYDTD